MKALGNNVLIEQTCTKKQNKIILANQKEDNDNLYLITMRIVGLGEGPECKASGLSEGDIPVLATWAEPLALKVTSGKSGDEVIMRQAIFHVGQIIATDNEGQI